MTISNTSRTAGPFIGNGISTVFPFPFKVFQRSDLLVAQTVTSTGVETILTLDSDYAVILNSDQNSNPGGNVQTTVPLAVGTTLAMTSNIQILQSLDLTNNGGFYPRAINDALDKIVIMVQQVGARVGLGLNVGGQAAIELLTSLATSVGSSLIGFIQQGVGAVLRKVQDKLREIPSITDYGAVGDGLTDNYDAINLALAANTVLYVPPGRFMTSAGSAGKAPHKITGKALIGQSREVSIIQATGQNEGRTLFVNDVTDVNNPGTWGSGKDFRLEKLYIRGNWDTTTGLSNVTESGATMMVGVKKADYNPATQTALVKGVSAAYPFIIDCYIDNAWEHGVLFYRTGYTEISGNIMARCRGSALWLTADSPYNAITSAVVERNQIVANRGGYGGLYTTYTYGCAFRDNRPFEDNTWGATFGEGADVDISGNYFEANPFGDASLDSSLWGLSMLDNYWTIAPVLPSGGAARGFFSYDRKNGLRHLCVGGLGETDNRLGPIRYSSESDTIGVGRGTPPAASGLGLSFPSVQAPSTDAYTLDDYAERTVVISDVSGADLAFTGGVFYTKVGRMVTVSGQLVFPTTASNAEINLSGILPVGAQPSAGIVMDNAGLGTTVILAPANDVRLELYAGGTFNRRTNFDFSGKVMFFSITYSAAS
jgi:hypothetical protein